MKNKHIAFVLIFLLSLASGIIIHSQNIKLSGEPNYSYNDFHELYIRLLNEFSSEDYLLISKNVESRMITVFPEGLLLEKRKTLCFEDDPYKPSKFEIFFEDIEATTMIKLNLIFTPGNSDRSIVHYQVISPEDNINLKDSYITIPRPIMVETYESFGDFGVLINVFSIDNNQNKSLEEKTINTISKSWEFVKQLESFLLTHS